MQAPLKKCIFHLAWSPDTLPTTDAIVPLQEYLDSHLIALNTNLIPKNFHKVLNGVWEVTVYELGHQMDGGSGDTKMSGFYERLYEALELLVEFFHAEGNGLPPEILTGSKWRRPRNRQTCARGAIAQFVLLPPFTGAGFWWRVDSFHPKYFSKKFPYYPRMFLIFFRPSLYGQNFGNLFTCLLVL